MLWKWILISLCAVCSGLLDLQYNGKIKAKRGKHYDNLWVSDKHANFIINQGNASFQEIQALEKKIVQRIFKEKGILLEREVIYISPKGEKL